MFDRKGIVWIAPEAADDWPPDRMVDPDSSLFWVSWQGWNEEENRQDHYENDAVVGADDAIRWGRARADVVLIRLDGNTLFSAGDDVLTEDPWDGHPLPPWPPPEPPEGWWKMSEAFIRERLREWREEDTPGEPLPEGWWDTDGLAIRARLHESEEDGETPESPGPASWLSPESGADEPDP